MVIAASCGSEFHRLPKHRAKNWLLLSALTGQHWAMVALPERERKTSLHLLRSLHHFTSPPMHPITVFSKLESPKYRSLSSEGRHANPPITALFVPALQPGLATRLICIYQSPPNGTLVAKGMKMRWGCLGFINSKASSQQTHEHPARPTANP